MNKIDLIITSNRSYYLAYSKYLFVHRCKKKWNELLVLGDYWFDSSAYAVNFLFVSKTIKKKEEEELNDYRDY